MYAIKNRGASVSVELLLSLRCCFVVVVFTWWEGGSVPVVEGPFVADKCVSPTCFYSQGGRDRVLVQRMAGKGGVTVVSAHEVKGAKLVRRYFRGGRVRGCCCAFFVSVCTDGSLHSFMFTLDGRVLRKLGPTKGGTLRTF